MEKNKKKKVSSSSRVRRRRERPSLEHQPESGSMSDASSSLSEGAGHSRRDSRLRLARCGTAVLSSAGEKLDILDSLEKSLDAEKAKKKKKKYNVDDEEEDDEEEDEDYTLPPEVETKKKGGKAKKSKPN